MKHRISRAAPILVPLIAATGLPSQALATYYDPYCCSSSSSSPVTYETSTSAGTEIVTTPETVRGQTVVYSRAIGHRTRAALTGRTFAPMVSNDGAFGERGHAAGDGFGAVGAWASYGRVESDNELAATASNGSYDNLLFGIDAMPIENVVFGISLGFENGDVDTNFNNGNVDSNGYTIAPYIGVLMNETWMLDVSLGTSNVDYDQYRMVGATRVTGSTDGDRWFFSGNLSGLWQRDDVTYGLRFGLLHASETQDGFTESNATVNAQITTDLTQLQFGGNLAYQRGPWEPFASLSYNYDVAQTQVAVAGVSNDRDDFTAGAGFNYYTQNGMTLSAEWNGILGRDDLDENQFMFSLRKDF